MEFVGVEEIFFWCEHVMTFRIILILEKPQIFHVFSCDFYFEYYRC
jgi:hypothetical protein